MLKIIDVVLWWTAAILIPFGVGLAVAATVFVGTRFGLFSAFIIVLAAVTLVGLYIAAARDNEEV